MYTICMKCIYCDHPYVYELADGQRKCGKCKRKFSPKKLARKQTLYEHFKKGHTARETALATSMHFATVQKYYETFRRNLAFHADDIYQQNAHRVTGYDEYLYLPKSLDIEKDIDKLQHFLTLSYDDKVYNIMMPRSRDIHFQSDDGQDNKLKLKYLKFNKVAKLSTAQTTITKFWDYFETFICRFKGVSDEQFIFYLKEAEWRFNTLSGE